MINTTLIWLLLIPIILSAITIYLIPRLSKGQVPLLHTIVIAVAGIFVSSSILYASFYIGKSTQTADNQIINGEVTGKNREHGSYKRPYDCNCRSVTRCSGSGKNRSCSSDRVCDTCWEDRYTVKWTCHSNIGSWTIDSLDRTTRAVYASPDPARYTQINIGDPASKSIGYTNYIKAVPDSLFRPAAEDLKNRYSLSIPEYPINIYDFYRVDRVIPVGLNIPNLKEWNDLLSNALKRLGPEKQANAVIVITKIADENYFYALQDAWVGGKKNDIVVVIGAPQFPQKPAWVRVMALTDNDLFRVKLRDSIKDIDELNAQGVVSALSDATMKHYKRKSMKDFEYLDAQIDPPMWFTFIIVALIILSYAGFWFFWYKEGQKIEAWAEKMKNIRGYRRL
jgi:hypothetical protein